jgi:hypothetical protein
MPLISREHYLSLLYLQAEKEAFEEAEKERKAEKVRMKELLIMYLQLDLVC